MRTILSFYKPASRVAVALSLLALAGCALPGSSYRAPAAYNAEDDSRIANEVDLYKITPALVAKINQTIQPNHTAKAAQLPDYEYRIGAGDVLNVIVWEHPELSIPQGSERTAEESGNLVHADGTIFYPYVGKLQVVGKTVIEVRDMIAERLKAYIRAPQMDVTVAAYRSQHINITGQVAKPLQIHLTDVPLNLLQAVQKAGGITDLGDWERVQIVREGKTQTRSVRAMLEGGDMSQNMLLADGDLIHIPSLAEQKAYVLGEVQTPKTIQFSHARISLIDAITQSGGLNNDAAKPSGVFVFRQPMEAGKKASVYQLDASDAAAYLLAERFSLAPKDVVFVTTAPIARWNRLISQLLPTVNLYRVLNGNELDIFK